MASAWPASPASSTGRRPVWSDSLPKVSRPASTASAYTPNTTVVASGENPQCAAYSAYIGVGAADAARNETTIDTSSRSATTISLAVSRAALVTAARRPHQQDRTICLFRSDRA